MPPSSTTTASAEDIVLREHPLYTTWKATWELLGEVVEGSGGFLDGARLMAHPRELNYALNPDGTSNFDRVVSEKEKYKRRKRLARYENFAAAMLDTFVGYQFAKPIVRSVEATEAARLSDHPLVRWWEDVDGYGTHIDDWLYETQVLASTFGHVWVVMDRATPQGAGEAVTQADEAPLRLRSYAALDCLDWIAPDGVLQEVKFREQIERTSLNDPIEDDITKRTQVRIWRPDTWSVMTVDGSLAEGTHGFGEPPAICWYARRRPHHRFVGRSLLGDGRLFIDHYNLVSELREIFRSQTFSLLNIRLAADEEVQTAKARLGDQMSVESIMWTRDAAQFLAPPEGPANLYMQEIEKVERKIYRLVGLPWEGDGREAEAADSRRIKAMDLNRLLTKQAQEAEKVDYAIARLWFIGTFGRERGLELWEASQIKIQHPEEFQTAAVQEAVEDCRSAMSLSLGPTANLKLRQNVLPVVLPDLTPEETDQIVGEMAQEAERQAALDAVMQGADAAMAEATIRDANEPEGEAGEGEREGEA